MVSAPAWRRSAAARSSPPAARAAASGCLPEQVAPATNGASEGANLKGCAMRAPDHPTCPPARLKRRAEFLRVGKGRRWHGTAMTVQVEERAEGDDVPDAGPRFGFTLTKKVGNAVVRNRARRRLREAVRLAPPDLPARPGHDYVIVGRIEAVRLPFEALGRELARGLGAVHERGRRRDRPQSPIGSNDAAAKPANTSRRAAPERTRPKP